MSARRRRLVRAGFGICSALRLGSITRKLWGTKEADMRSSRPAIPSTIAVLLGVLFVYAVQGLSASAATIRATATTNCGKGTNLVGNATFHAGSGGDYTAANNPNGIPKW